MSKFIDLTHFIDELLPHFPGDQKIVLNKIKQIDRDKYNDYLIQMNMHTGTHIDSPMHLTKDEKFISDYSIQQFIREAIVIQAKNQTVIAYKKEYETMIKPDSCVLIYTGHDKYFYHENYYLDYPVISDELASLFIKKKIKMLGLDTPSPDKLPYDIHKNLLEHGIFIMENLTNLEKLLDQSFEVHAIPLKIKADSSPARVFARIIE